jgi:arylsulfatase A-like enzyme
MRRLPNLIVIGVDTLRADHLSGYGYPRLTSPHLDAFAQEGTLFERHFSPSIPTTPGYASMFTGKDCFGTGVVALRHPGDLAAGTITLAEVLKAQGYHTVCVGFDHNPAVRGFDTYLNYQSWEPDPNTGRAPKAENLTRSLLPHLKMLAQTEQPFFLFLRHMDPHAPYLPPQPFDRLFYAGDECDPDNRSLDVVYQFRPFADFFKSWFPDGVTDSRYIDAQYDGAVAYLDVNLGVLFELFKTLGYYDDSLIVVTSDHGESLLEHACYYEHHGLYDPTLHVPFILRYPKKVPAGLRVTGVSRAQDVMPTLLELLDLTDPALSFDGTSLTTHWRQDPSLKNEPSTNEPTTGIYLTEATWMRKHGWRTSEWKLIQALEPDFHAKPAVELYDLVHDPGETVNLADAEPERVRSLTAAMHAHIAKRVEQTGRPNPIETATHWHGLERGPFTSSDEAYQTLYIGSIKRARQLQQTRTEEEP